MNLSARLPTAEAFRESFWLPTKPGIFDALRRQFSVPPSGDSGKACQSALPWPAGTPAIVEKGERDHGAVSLRMDMCMVLCCNSAA